MKKRFLLAVLLIIAIIVIDQVIKLAVINSGYSYKINSGIALSILEGRSSLSTFVSAAGILIAGIFLIQIAREHRTDAVQMICLSLIIGGGISNLLDRLRRGAVIDYIQFGPIPTFNFADFAISTGVFVLLILIISRANGPKNAHR